MINKTILIFYINVGHANSSDTSVIIERVRNAIKPLKEDENKILQYVIPVRDQETKVECLNAPTLIFSEEHLEKYKAEIKRMDDRLDRITSVINAESETRNVIVEKM